jgi:hypothetical protein
LAPAVLSRIAGAFSCPRRHTAATRRQQPGNGSVAATLGGVTLSSGARSPLVGAYTLVPAGTLPVNVAVNRVATSAYLSRRAIAAVSDCFAFQ